MSLILASSIAVMVVLASGIVNSQEKDRVLAATKQFFEKKVQPVLRANCFECHAAKKQEGDLRIDQLDLDVVNGADAGKWEDVLERINSGEMPPEKSQQLTTAERRGLVSWLTEQLDRAAEEKRATGGHAVFRQLNRYEYQNTMRDLLGIDLDYTSDLPPDGNSEDGFKNNGQFLGISSIQLELYHTIARKAMRNAIVTHSIPEVHKVREEVAKRAVVTWAEVKRRDELTAAFNKANPKDKKSNHGIKLKSDPSAADANETTDDDASGRGRDKGASKKDAARPKDPGGLNSDNLISNRLAPGNWYDVGLKTDFTREGLVRVRINCYAVIPKSGEVPRLRVGLGYRSTRKIQFEGILGDEVDVTSIAPQTFEFVVRAEDMPMPVVPSLGGAGGKGAFHIRIRNVARGKVDVLGLPKNYRKDELQRQAEYGENDPRPILVINWAEYGGPIFKSWRPEHHTRWLPSADPSQSEESRARNALVRFIERAYRRPVNEAEVEAKLSYFKEIRSEYSSFEEAMREVFSAVLVSPHFLYLVETKSADGSRLPIRS